MRHLPLLATVVTMALLNGCASAPPQPPARELHGKVVCDQDYVNAVHGAARRAGTKVVWVVCPNHMLRYVPSANPGEVG